MWQRRGYKKNNPATKHQAAIPPSVYKHAIRHARTHRRRAISRLLGAAFFFAMRSCEYTKVRGARLTRTVQVKRVRFFQRRREISHDDSSIFDADSVTIEFERQKNSKKFVSITMPRSKDPVLCPVKLLADTIQRIRSYPGFTPEWTIDMAMDDRGVVRRITSAEVADMIKSSVRAIGKDVLGFGPADVGTHSNRSASAMAMYLANVPVFTIMLIGRWSSDAFLLYIRKQIQDFTSGVSDLMTLNGSFFTIPGLQSNNEDPRSRHDQQSFASASQIGGNVNRRVTEPRFHLNY